ncbi:MAG TPA: BlaI/MecI/CopY family transcriptional regulator, partial [Armatimonadota bacterium]|nr:BlaI/MecI/CopY family transcriptional regulator [Armatimonadota bacterium]
GFGQERSLARTTVLTVMERLRKKGYLTRKRREGAFRYWPCVPQAQVLQNLVSRFVERTLGGSVSPVVAYLADAKRISEADLAELEKLVNELRSEKESEG